MNTRANNIGKAWLPVLAASMILSLAFSTPAIVAAQSDAAHQNAQAPTRSTIGKGAYKTIVERETEGELSAEDFRQVSTLASQILIHLGAASEQAVDEEWQAARDELQHAQTLIGVIRDLLPTTTVTTIVKDADGREVYRYAEQVQDDQIPLFEGMVTVDVLEAVVDKKKEEASLKGVRLADAELIHSSALLDLSYVERKVDRALALLNNEPADALAQLLYAHSRGVQFVVNREDDPLVKAQSAIRLAERMVREGKHEAAEENLNLAKLHLETYRSVLGEEASARVKELQDEIEALAGRTAEAGSAKEIRGFWDRVTSWFQDEPGAAHVTTGDSENESRMATSGEREDHSN